MLVSPIHGRRLQSRYLAMASVKPCISRPLASSGRYLSQHTVITFKSEMLHRVMSHSSEEETVSRAATASHDEQKWKLLATYWLRAVTFKRNSSYRHRHVFLSNSTACPMLRQAFGVSTIFGGEVNRNSIFFECYFYSFENIQLRLTASPKDCSNRRNRTQP
jgi:hypothetical protein